MSIGTVLLIIVIFMLVGVFPAWPHHGFGYGYYPFGGGLGLVLIILVVLALMGRL